MHAHYSFLPALFALQVLAAPGLLRPRQVDLDIFTCDAETQYSICNTEIGATDGVVGNADPADTADEAEELVSVLGLAASTCPTEDGQATHPFCCTNFINGDYPFTGRGRGCQEGTLASGLEDALGL